MKFLHYTRYFFYLAWNWNIRIAWHIIRNEVRGEKQYGIDTTGADELKQLEERGIDIEHSTIYMPASYDLVEKVFDELKGRMPRHLLDIGCGKGRVLCMAAHYGIHQLTGIDFSKQLCEDARNNLQKTAAMIPGINYRIYNNDAFYFEIPPDVDAIFMFNPFDEVIMSGVVVNILDSLEAHPRTLTVIYLNPLEKQLFTQEGFKETFHTMRKGYLEASILVKQMPGRK